MWNDRFREEEFAYGKKPNNYLKEQLEKLNPGKILFPAEGEGRNAVFAAINNWDVSAVDISIEGQKKANQLAKSNNVSIDYQIEELQNLKYKADQFDAIALIHAHFPPTIRATYHKKIVKFLKKDGTIIIEGFSKKHLEYNSKNPKVGGPKNIDFLFSIEEIKAEFQNFEIIELVEKEIELNEGAFHIGKASVIRFVGRKK